jgi:hypothetical protein
MLPAVRAPVALLAVAVALAGCGGGPSDEQLVAQTVTSFGRATAAKDYTKLCTRILSPTLVDKVEQIGLPCEQALQKALGSVQDPRLTIGQIRVRGDSATADVRTSAANQSPSRDTLELQKVKGSWRIASLGSSG